MDYFSLLGLVIALCLVVSAAGFFRVVYFISTGYAFSVAAVGILGIVMFRVGIRTTELLQLGLLAAYGLRLGAYILVRQRASSYRTQDTGTRSQEAKVGRLLRFPIWIGVSLLYAAMTLPAWISAFRVSQGLGTSGSRTDASPGRGLAVPLIGLAIMLIGLLLETAADAQKARFKKRNANRYCDVGLFRMVRHPNYLGEIVFWTGNLVVGVAWLSAWHEWLLASIGYVCIVLIMLGATRRLEFEQESRYGKLPEFRTYAGSVPILIPLVPLYSFKRLRVYLG